MLSINSVVELSPDIFAENTAWRFLLTSRLNQEPAENIFAQIRQKNGNNRNPSVAIFNHSVAKIMSMKLITSFLFLNKNCENDDDLFLEWEDIGEESSPKENVSGDITVSEHNDEHQ